MSTLFLVLAAIALLGLLLALFKPGCGFLGLCKTSRYMPIVVWLTIFVVAIALWRNETPSSKDSGQSLMALNTTTEQSASNPDPDKPAANKPATNKAATEPPTLRERVDETVDSAAGVAADAYNATREKVNEFGQGASETWDEVKESTGKTLEKAGGSIKETGKEIQQEDKPIHE